MCDVDECCGVEQCDAPLAKSASAIICYKCKKVPATVGGRDKACQSCFLTVVENNFKSILCTHLKVDRNTKLGLCMGTGKSSITMESLVTCAMRGKNPRIHTHENIVLYHVDVFGTLPKYASRNGVGSVATVEFLQTLAADRNARLRVIPLSFGIDSPLSAESISSLESMSSTQPDVASRLVRTLVRRALIRAGEEDKLNALVLASTADRLAVRTVQLACQGGGIHMPDECGPEDRRVALISAAVQRKTEGAQGLRLVRPCHNMFAKDMALYNTFKAIPETPVGPSFGGVDVGAGKVDAKAKPAPAQLCVDFLMSLQQQQGATSQVVTRTIAKLDPLRVPNQISRAAEEQQGEEAHVSTMGLSAIPLLGSMKMSGGCIWGGWCGLCGGRKEATVMQRTRWAVKQKEVLASSIGSSRQEALCLQCLRLAATSHAAGLVVNELFDTSRACVKLD